MGERESYSVRLLPKLFKKLKLLAVNREKTLSHCLEEAIQYLLKKYSKEGK